MGQYLQLINTDKNAFQTSMQNMIKTVLIQCHVEKHSHKSNNDMLSWLWLCNTLAAAVSQLINR